MANPLQVEISLADADDNGICLSQTPLAGGNLTIAGALASGGVATLDQQRQVLLTFAADETGRTFVVYGTNEFGNAITESVAGAAATATTIQDFKTVTRISIDAASAGAIIVGTNGVANSPWLMLNWDAVDFTVGIGVVVTGTVNFTVQVTYDNPNSPYTSTYPTAFNISALASKTANTDSSITAPVYAVRLRQNSFSSGATLKMIAIQAGLGGH